MWHCAVCVAGALTGTNRAIPGGVISHGPRHVVTDDIPGPAVRRALHRRAAADRTPREARRRWRSSERAFLRGRRLAGGPRAATAGAARAARKPCEMTSRLLIHSNPHSSRLLIHSNPHSKRRWASHSHSRHLHARQAD